MMVLKRKNWQFMQRSILTYSVDHTVLESRINVHRPDQLYGYKLENKGGNPEYLQ